MHILCFQSIHQNCTNARSLFPFNLSTSDDDPCCHIQYHSLAKCEAVIFHYKRVNAIHIYTAAFILIKFIPCHFNFWWNRITKPYLVSGLIILHFIAFSFFRAFAIARDYSFDFCSFAPPVPTLRKFGNKNAQKKLLIESTFGLLSQQYQRKRTKWK